MRKVFINESEKKQIIEKHSTAQYGLSDEIVISDWLSPDEKYVIFLDELYDLENKKKLGDIWKSPDNLLLFLEHTFRVSKLRKEIKEHASKIFDQVLLYENEQDLTYLKPTIKEFLISEGRLDDLWSATKEYGGKALNYAGKFLKDTAVNTVTGVTQFGKDLVTGGVKLGSAALSGNWEEVMDLLKKGTKWLARKIRQAVYSPVGIIIDTILIATEVGKIPQAGIWAIVVALDIYEFVTGDYEDKDELMIFRILFFLVDILGLVTAGAAAVTARTALKATGGTISGLERTAAKSPWFRTMLESMFSALKKLPSKLAEFGSMLGKGQFGKLFKLGLSNVGKFINFILEQVKSAFKSPALKPVLVNAGIITGIGTGVEALKDYRIKKNEEQSKIEQEKQLEDEKNLTSELIDTPTDMSSQL